MGGTASSYGSNGRVVIFPSNVAGGTSCQATGGTITEVNGYRIHTFTSNGTFTPTGAMALRGSASLFTGKTTWYFDGGAPTGPAPQSFEFWHALRAQHVPTQLVVYPNEGHGFTDPAHRRDVLERAVEWFGRYMPAGDQTAPL